MQPIFENKKVVMTLDAGGTNLVFSAMKGGQEIAGPFTYPTPSENLDECLSTIIKGFKEVEKQLSKKAEAISFAFPGPADYKKGIIGDLPNFKAFTGGVPLGPMIEDLFHLPVFINNDGNLFAYGEALCGFLPELNRKIQQKGGIKQFHNLIGLTLGTGFGCGVVLNNNLLIGDNSNDTGIHNTLNKFNPDWNAEESVSTRAIQRVYAEVSGIPFSREITPKDVYHIAKGTMPGNREAALEAYRRFGEALGSSIANILTLIDGIVVVGGGIAGAWDLFSPAMFTEINRKYKRWDETTANRLDVKVYNLEDEKIFNEFALGNIREVNVPFSNRTITYDETARVGIGLSKLGASKAIALGAYAYAIWQLEASYSAE